MNDPRKGHKMERVTQDTISLVPSSVLKNYKNIYLDIDLPFKHVHYKSGILGIWRAQKNNLRALYILLQKR